MRNRAVLFVAPLLLLALLPGAATAAGPKPNPQAQSRAAVLAYWTPERIATAKPIELKHGANPNAKPGGGGGAGATTGASWPTATGDPITRITGKVLFSMDGGNWVCSGSVMDDTRNGTNVTFSVVLTAGHCVVDADSGEWATNWLFVPAYDLNPTFTCVNTALGCWTASALVARREFATAGGFNDEAVQHDWGFAVMQGGGKTANANLALDTTVGGGLALQTGSAVGATVTALGYPAAGKYRGNDLVYCRGTVGTDPLVDDRTYGLPCAMTGGSSGGPWVGDTALGYNATARSLNSYGYSGVRTMFGPVFNAETSATLNAANNATSGNVLVP
jgi:hypothetical protein